MTYLVRKLTQEARVPLAMPDRRDVLGGVDYTNGAVFEVSAEQVELTSDEVAEGLERRWLRTTDLVMLRGTWTPLGESMPFAELCEPFARREQRLRTLKGSLVLFGTLSIYLLIGLARVFLVPHY